MPVVSSDLVLLDGISPCSSLLIMLGVGDGQLLERILDDPAFNKKDIVALAFPGDDIPTRQLPPTTTIRKVTSWDDIQDWIHCHFSDHNDIVRLGGADVLDSHVLGSEAAHFRDHHLGRIAAVLADRPWALGNDINDSFMGLHHAACNARRLLPAPSIGQLCGSLGPVPCISIGAGPSVGSHLDELRALQDKCILVACDAVYPGLVKEGIIPQFVTPLERLKQQAPLVACAAGTRTIFAGIPACHPDAVMPFGERVIYLHAFDKLYDWLAPLEELRCLTGSSTGVLSFYVAASLARGPVYLVGHDLAKDANASHWSGAALADKAFAQESAQAGGFGTNGYEARMIPGNDGGLVESIMWWDNFRGEISSQARLCGSRVFNVNAHDKRYALIEHTQAAPLPDPATLSVLPPIVPQMTNHARLHDWQSRARTLPQDCDALMRGMDALHAEIAAMIRQPPHTWSIDNLMRRITPEAHVSPGNVDCFRYVLRSAIYNEQVYTAYRARDFTSKTEAYYTTMKNLDGLADAMANAVTHLKPVMESIAHDD